MYSHCFVARYQTMRNRGAQARARTSLRSLSQEQLHPEIILPLIRNYQQEPIDRCIRRITAEIVIQLSWPPRCAEKT